VLQQIKQARAQFVASGASSYAYALIIDGKSLVYALEDEIKYKFLELAIGCASVICCRSSPKQKALVSSYEFLFFDLWRFRDLFFICIPLNSAE